MWNTGCPNANEDVEAPASRPFHQLAVRDSDTALYNSYRWGSRGQSHKRLTLENMPDYWECLVHFTGEEGFLKILQSDLIETNPTGYYGKRPEKTRSVCLTEAPLDFSARFFKSYGPIGFVFRKGELQKIGALPLMQLSQAAIQAQEDGGGFVDRLKPFVQLIRTTSTGSKGRRRYDWIHDREWRVPVSIDLSRVRPIGVVFSEPVAFTAKGNPLWRAKIEAAIRYNEITLEHKPAKLTPK